MNGYSGDFLLSSDCQCHQLDSPNIASFPRAAACNGAAIGEFWIH